MKRLSTPSELQQAIDGNKREGRRSGYDTYSMFPGPRPQVPLPPSSLPLPQISPLPPGLRPSFNGGAAFPGSLGKLSNNGSISKISTSKWIKIKELWQDEIYKSKNERKNIQNLRNRSIFINGSKSKNG